MPELPEVENVMRSLEALGPVGQRLTEVDLKSPSLRTPLKKNLKDRLPGQRVTALKRRAKYLLIETDDYVVLSHLGMTGSWRAFQSGDVPIKHDHVFLTFDSGLCLAFNDPRRFGRLELVNKKEINSHQSLKDLGPEPLEDTFSGPYLFAATRGLNVAMKSFLMDQRRVVGVGNIYASEALFRAGVKPNRLARRLKEEEAVKLSRTVKSVLKDAIEKGGSTIRDFKNTNGQSGRYQNEFFVYGRGGEACRVCQAPIRSKFIVGRNTFWCPKCQL